MKKFLWIFVLLICMVCLVSCGSKSSNRRQNNGGYSTTYQNNGEYRKNVDGAAEIYGVSPKEIDQTINRFTNGK